MTTIKKERYQAIDIMRVIGAIFVIAIHTKISSTFPDEIKCYFDLALSMAVPFFFITSGYFVGISNKNESILVRRQLIKQLKSVSLIYLIWNAIYLPLTIYGEVSYGNGLKKALFKMVRGWLLVGQNYYSWAFWYLLAMIVALFMIIVVRRIFLGNTKIQLLIGFVLFLCGICIDYAYHTMQIDSKFLQLYYDLFMTTRNGFFLGYFYVSVGMCFGEMDISHLKKKWIGALFLIVFLVLGKYYSDGGIGYAITALISILLFWVILTLNDYITFDFDTRKLRDYSTGVYVIHMLFVWFCDVIVKQYVSMNLVIEWMIVLAASSIVIFILYRVKVGGISILKWLHVA